MRTSVSLMLALLLGTCAWAQRGGGMRGGFGGGVRMGGGGVRVGVGGFRSGFVGGPFHGGGFGAFRGFRGGFARSGFHNRFGRGFRNGFDVGVGFGLPVGGFGFSPFGGLWGGGFYPYYGTFDPMYSSYFNPCSSYVWNNDCGYPDYTMIGGYNAQPAQPAVVISQQFSTPPAHPVITEYPDNSSYGGGTSMAEQQYAPAASTSRARGAESPIYLIAFRDQVIRPALAYWVKGGTLYYLGMDHREKQVPLSSVDRAFSQQLNDERNVPFRLPA